MRNTTKPSNIVVPFQIGATDLPPADQARYLSLLIESLDHPFYVINTTDFTIAFGNSAALKARKQGLNTCHALIQGRATPCDDEHHPCPLRNVLETRKPSIVEHIHTDAQGRRVYVEVHCYPIFEDHDAISQVIVYSLDVTRKKETELALKRNLELQKILFNIVSTDSRDMTLQEIFDYIHIQLGSVVDTSNFYIAIYDPEHELLTFPYYMDAVDSVPEPVPVGKGLTGYVLKSGKSLLVSKAEIFEMNQQGLIELIGTPSEQWLGVPLKVIDKVVGVIAVQSYTRPDQYQPEDVRLLEFIAGHIGDVIVHKQSEAEIQKSERIHRELSQKLRYSNNMKDLLLDIITHDLKNPAGVISGMAEMVCAASPDDENLNLIKIASEGLLKVIGHATTLSQISMDEEIEKSDLDLSTLIATVVKEFRSQLQESGMTLSVDIPNNLMVKANPIITEIFGNYISNAIKYAVAGKRLIVECAIKNNIAELKFRDFGQSIPESEYEKVFVRSIQLEQGLKRGRGLGLAIVKRIAEAHGAEVGVTANQPKGNTFYLKIPVRTTS